ncbi:MAG: T9SS type A sorting domain-containing protein [Candidatus Marinimicrobia bacterium]|nr:T9SS type A sorting domain-containing protein [Candidatus Neomarinimicrobiota bacterium]
MDSSHLVSEIPDMTYSWGHDVIVNSNGQAIVCYTAEINNSHWNVYLRVINPDGSFVGSSAAINDYPALGAATVELAIDEADWGVIVWEGIDTATNTSLVAAQRFGSDINLLGNNFIVARLSEGGGINYSVPTVDIWNGNIYTSWTTPESSIKVSIIDFNNPPVEIDNERDNFLDDFSLTQNFPNPFNPITTIQFYLPEHTQVVLTIYDLLGREIDVLINEIKSLGLHKVRWDASNVASGIYFYRLEIHNQKITKKMVLLN